MKTVEELESEVINLRNTLGTLIVWIAQSGVGVLSPSDAGKLLSKLHDKTGENQ